MARLKTLTRKCRICGKVRTFTGTTVQDLMDAMDQVGWIDRSDNDDSCPECAKLDDELWDRSTDED